MRGTGLTGLALVVLAGCGEDRSGGLGCLPETPPVTLQLAGPVVAGPDANGQCSIRGDVVRAFGIGQGTGAPMTVSVECQTGQTEGEAAFVELDPATLRGAPVIEVGLLSETGPVATGQSSLAVLPLDAPTDQPVWDDFLLICY